MEYDITTRGQNGREETLRLSAADRASLFEELARRGVSAIRVTEASGKAKARPDRAAGGPVGASHLRLLAWGLVELAVAVGAYLVLPSAEKRASAPAARTAERPPETTKGSAEAAAPSEGRQDPKTPRNIAAEFGEQVKPFIKKAMTNETQWIVPPLDPKDPDNALRTRVCQELGSLLSIEPGEPMPPFPYSFLLEDDMRKAAAAGEEVGEIDNGNKGFLEDLAKHRIQAKEGDDADRLAHKERLLQAQGELLEALDEGLSVNDAIRAAYEFRKRAYETRTELSGLLREISKEDGMDIGTFREQLDIANAKLAEQGIKTIPLEEILPDAEEDLKGKTP